MSYTEQHQILVFGTVKHAAQLFLIAQHSLRSYLQKSLGL